LPGEIGATGTTGETGARGRAGHMLPWHVRAASAIASMLFVVTVVVFVWAARDVNAARDHADRIESAFCALYADAATSGIDLSARARAAHDRLGCQPGR
jgi:hypothetical protein